MSNMMYSLNLNSVCENLDGISLQENGSSRHQNGFSSDMPTTVPNGHHTGAVSRRINNGGVHPLTVGSVDRQVPLSHGVINSIDRHLSGMLDRPQFPQEPIDRLTSVGFEAMSNGSMSRIGASNLIGRPVQVNSPSNRHSNRLPDRRTPSGPPLDRFLFDICPNCNKEMTNEKILPCSHFVCSPCLESHSWANSFVCPICRHEHNNQSSLPSRDMERMVMGLFDGNLSSSTNEIEREIWNACLDTTNNSPNGSTPKSGPSPSINGHDIAIPGNRIVDGISSVIDDKFRSHSYPTVNNNFLHQSQVKEQSGRSTQQAQTLSNVQFNDLLFQNDSQPGNPKIPPLSPVVGGESRTTRVTASSLQPQLNITEGNEFMMFDFERGDSEIPKCVHKIHDFYCPHCRIAFCSMCIYEHQNHRYLPWVDANPILRVILRDILNETQSRERDVDNSFVKTRTVMEHMDINRIAAERDIEVAFKKILYSVLQRKNSILQLLHRVHRTKCEILLKQMNTLKNAKQSLTMIHRGIYSKLESGNTNTEDLIHSQIKGNDGLKRLDYLGSKLQPHEDSSIWFDVNMKSILDEVAKIGLIRTHASAADSKVTGVNLKTAIVHKTLYFTVRCFDHAGNRRIVGGDPVRAVAIFPSGKRVNAEVKDFENGDYVLNFQPQELGKHTIEVSLRGLIIRSEIHYPMVKNHRRYADITYPPLETFGQNKKNEHSLSRGWGITCDRDGNIYVTERDIHCVLVFDYELNFVHKFGVYGDLDGQLNRPAGITVDHELRRIVVVDKDNHRIQIFNIDGKFIKRFGRRGSCHGEFQYPWDVATNSKSQILVSDSRNHRVQLFDKEGIFVLSTEDTLGKCNFKTLEIPRGVCFDQNENIIVIDFNNHHLLFLSPQLTNDGITGRYGETEGFFYRPQGVLVDSRGNIIVTESKNCRLQMLTSHRKSVKLIQTPDKDQPFAPCDIIESPDGFYYVVDIDYGCIYKF